MCNLFKCRRKLQGWINVALQKLQLCFTLVWEFKWRLKFCYNYPKCMDICECAYCVPSNRPSTGIFKFTTCITTLVHSRVFWSVLEGRIWFQMTRGILHTALYYFEYAKGSVSAENSCYRRNVCTWTTDSGLKHYSLSQSGYSWRIFETSHLK